MKLSRSKVLLFVTVAVLMTAAAASAQLEVVTNNAANPNPLDPSCVREGEYGMRITTATGETNPMFVLAGAANGFDDETVFRAQFWFNPRDMFREHGRRHFILEALPGTRQTGQYVGIQSPFRVSIFRNAFTGEYKLEMGCRVNCVPNDGTCPSAATFPRLVLNPGGTASDWSLVQVEWAHDSSPGVWDGICRISIIDGSGAGQTAEVGITNRQYSIDSIKLGFVGGVWILPDSDGTHCYDDFASFRTLAP